MLPIMERFRSFQNARFLRAGACVRMRISQQECSLRLHNLFTWIPSKLRSSRCLSARVQDAKRCSSVRLILLIYWNISYNLSCSGKLLEKGLITEAAHDWMLTAPAVSNVYRHTERRAWLRYDCLSNQNSLTVGKVCAFPSCQRGQCPLSMPSLHQLAPFPDSVVPCLHSNIPF